MKFSTDIPHPEKPKIFFSSVYLLLCLLFCSPIFPQQTYLVNSTADLEDQDLADSVCADEFNNCTLRAAIQNANKTSEKDKIEFRLPGIGPFTIKLRENLPEINEPVILDATSQPFYRVKSPLVVLDGSSLPLVDWDDCFDLSECPLGFYFTGNSSGSEVKGFVIGGFGYTDFSKEPVPGNFFMGTAILVKVSNLKIQANFVGIAADGISSFSNLRGITLHSNGHLIGGLGEGELNIISGNQTGIFSYSGNKIVGNFIGTCANGEKAVPNDHGIDIPFHGRNIVIIKNLISGNNLGLTIQGDDIEVYENKVGTDVWGKKIISNKIGINLNNANRTRIGAKNRGNLISGNNQGLIIKSRGLTVPQENRIIGNFIGTDVEGRYDLPNEVGIQILNGHQNVVGSLKEGEGNTISGNTIAGIELEGAFQNHITGNFIGTDPKGDRSIPNLKGIVLRKEKQTKNGRQGTANLENEISANLISGNHEHGIEFFGGIHNSIHSNIIGLDDSNIALPNGGCGMYISSLATENCIGGLTASEANMVGHNKTYGIFIKAEGEQVDEKVHFPLLENIVFDNCEADIFFETPSKPKKKKQKSQPLLSVATKE